MSRSGRRHWRAAPSQLTAQEVRHSLEEWLREQGRDDADVGLVAAELLSNAARAARQMVCLSAALLPDAVALEVADDGPGVDWDAANTALRSVAQLPRPVDSDEDYLDEASELPDGAGLAEGGRGLFIVRMLAQSFDIVTTAQGSRVQVSVAAPLVADVTAQGDPAGTARASKAAISR